MAAILAILLTIVGVIGPSLATDSEPSLNQQTNSFNKQNQYYDSSAYVLELSNHKINQNNDDDEMSDFDNGSNTDNKNKNNKISTSKDIRSYNNFNNGSDYGSFSNRDTVVNTNRHFFSNNNNNNFFHHNGDDGDKMNNALNRGPFFDVSASKNVTALVGKTANLNCRIKNLGNKTVTWIRHRDLHLLTVDKTTYTSDQRFVSVNNPQIGDWSLQIRHTQKSDSGIYECQVSTTPPVGFSMILSVVEPVTTVLGGPDLYIDIGSTINLTCIVRHLPEPPSAILWAHKNQEINYDSPRGGVSVITEKGEVTTSYLLIQKAKISDSGKYTCMPTHANPNAVNVHVLNGEEPAAIQRGTHLQGTNFIIFILILVVFVQHKCTAALPS